MGGAAGAERPASGGAGAAAAPEAGAAGDAAAPLAARSAAMAAPAAGGAAAPAAGPAAPSGARQADAGALGAAGAPHTAGAPQSAGASQSAAAPLQSAGHAGLGETAPARHNGGGWVGQLIKWLGVDHERLLAASVSNSPQKEVSQTKQPGEGSKLQQPENKPAALHQTEPEYSGRSERAALTINTSIEKAQLPAPPGTQLTDDGALRPDAAKPAMDSLKSALMTLASSDDVPQALRDTAQQLVQHITGQQLLLTPERTNTPFTHVTMFIPLQGPDGGQTASVHIQTRRGRKGELDGNNCRLLFDLRMKTLGETVVDVNVVDKIVSLNLWNDHPAISELLEASRSEMNEALQNAGFQLLSLRSTPMPDRRADSPGGPEIKPGGPSPAHPDWSTKRYKGVDFRV
ncbi:flagellar hook-length control protein FliK [Paenibacillus sp. sptzw28]|uniref:flagellar hook-length control protein FliK n=1 Tax=Paenibacillus sp. sptzw28 TaxID=715179 RepID=UPI001C6E19EC|nr:flagellar hook-length control protein FliK [Paenibacillus sp. sptzw28]QYR19794.1 flagellar hook-length control protein FliK [Paenibacillus sp. sptzw28]